MGHDDVTAPMPEEAALFRRGADLRRQVLGDAHVARQGAGRFEDADDLQRLVTEIGWGTVWQRGVLDLKSRSLVTVAMLVALDRPHELVIHVRGALNNGATTDEITEVVLHAILYCGFPAAIDAMRHVHAVFDEVAKESE